MIASPETSSFSACATTCGFIGTSSRFDRVASSSRHSVMPVCAASRNDRFSRRRICGINTCNVLRASPQGARRCGTVRGTDAAGCGCGQPSRRTTSRAAAWRAVRRTRPFRKRPPTDTCAVSKAPAKQPAGGGTQPATSQWRFQADCPCREGQALKGSFKQMGQKVRQRRCAEMRGLSNGETADSRKRQTFVGMSHHTSRTLQRQGQCPVPSSGLSALPRLPPAGTSHPRGDRRDGPRRLDRTTCRRRSSRHCCRSDS